MTTQEDQLRESIDFLRNLSNRVYDANDDQWELTSQLNGISAAGKNALWLKYQNANGPVTKIRREVAQIILERDLTVEELTKIIETAKSDDPNSFSRMYTAWYKILYPLLLWDYNDGMTQAIDVIRDTVLSTLGNSSQLNFVSFDFTGERNTGSIDLWLAFYNHTHPNQKMAKQLFLVILNGEVMYCLYDRRNKAQFDKVRVEKNVVFDSRHFLERFEKDLPDVLADSFFAHDRLLPLYEGQSVYKISMGADIFKEDEDFNFFLDEKLVAVHGDTPAKARAPKTQAELFINEMKVGDYFYLCRGNTELVLIGRILSQAADVTHDYWVDEGWLQRKYEVIEQSIRKGSYEGVQKWWTPNDRSTCIRIPDEEVILANQWIFSPFFSAFFQPTSDGPTLIKPTINYIMKELNTILFGPPGTGKTYATIEKAIQLANRDFVFVNEDGNPKSRELVKAEFERIKDKENRILFVTFHQSSNYEDFVEGIKPTLDSDQGSEKLSYSIQPGIFKKAAALAAYQCYAKWQEELQPNRGIGMSFEALYQAFIGHLESELTAGRSPEFTTITGKTIKVVRINRNDSIVTERLNARRLKEEPPKTKDNMHKLYDRFLSIDQIKNLDQIQETIQIQPGISGFYALFKGLKDFERGLSGVVETEEKTVNETEEFEIIRQFEASVYDDAVRKVGTFAKPVVLIIDEINRGNISAILGELITLLEPDKRWGSSEELKVRLTYSKTEFYIPPNLYLVGTMNTADRSVEALDTALRRRFQFEFMPPRPDLLKNKIGEAIVVETIELGSLLQKINQRIVYLTDEDHQIGHAYFMSVKSLDDLRMVFERSIIPLLKEYFYNDFGKIRLVLGDGFVKREGPQYGKQGFAVNDESFLLEKTTYRLGRIDKDFDIVSALKQTMVDA